MAPTDELARALDQLEAAVKRHTAAEYAHTAALERAQLLAEVVKTTNNELINMRQHFYRVLEFQKA
jgi:hypothetical protein